jgi:hypothetical protein
MIVSMGVADAFRVALPLAAESLGAGFGLELKPEERLRQAVAEELRGQRQIAEVVTEPEWRPEMRWWPNVPQGRLGGFDLAFRDIASPFAERGCRDEVERRWH